MKIGYVTELYDQKMSYRENILCEYFVRNNFDLDIFYARGSGPTSSGIRCNSVQIFGLVFYFSVKFLKTKYDYILVSDLRQPSSIIYILCKLFSNSKVIIEHEQRSFGATLKGRILTSLMYLPTYICYLRADLIRSPNSFSTNYLRNYPLIDRKIIELPLAVSIDEINVKPAFTQEKGGRLRLFWSGKRFWEKCGALLLDYVDANFQAKLTVVTDENLNIDCSRVVQTERLLNRTEFDALAKKHDLAIYLSPTQSFYDVAALGIPVVVASSALPRCDPKYLENFLPIPFSCDTQGNVLDTVENQNMLELEIKRFCRDSSLGLRPSNSHFAFDAADLWIYYESA